MWNEARLINATANLLMVLAVLALLAGALLWVVRLPAFDIKRIVITPTSEAGFQYVSPDVVRSAIAGRLTGNFFSMGLQEAREAFESAPWVRQVSVRRAWPNELQVEIEEQQPLAYWNENQMINTWGEVFTANRAVLDESVRLPQFYGPEGSESLMVQRYAELGQWFERLGLGVDQLMLNNRYALQAQLSNGVTLLLGRDPGAETADPQAGVPGAVSFGERIERFVRNWPQAVDQLQGKTVERVDLRYPNGFAITLAQVPTPVNSNKKR
ncbi:cell division protein FtsQ/DivIB [Orrella daihaiensis]|uniref:Cell division protein FtsQ n=1 Tax=Orrella daihaiensis TaxID=2782176 RepID=A0ABY4ALB9_9BURK|nr:cell division protein FtsQ/DivIB [Orrella daihaiensis]UOD50843.1 cell division protein FtsQ/DivIB [Orrella daihaiensis]